jgi:nucleoside-diphosphate-sugar epimerase
MRVLLTGASGFVGIAALDALGRRGAEVHAISRRQPLSNVSYEWHSIDLLDGDALTGAVRRIRPDVILHLAWVVEHGVFWTSPQNLDWVGASLALARAGAESGMHRFVGAGTCYEYDWPADSDCAEFATPLRPSTLYGVCKDATRRAIETFSEEAGFRFVWARLFFLYGPGEGRKRLIPAVARSLAALRAAKCTSGDAVRDFMDVRDAGEALAAVALSDLAGPINIATGTGTRIADVAQKLGTISGRPDLVQLGALPDRSHEPPRIVADVTRLKSELDFRPRRDLCGGLRDAYEYWAARKTDPDE